MKKLFGALLALASSVAFATTTVPVQLLNPAGSSSGQAIVSTGSSSAPAWGGVGVNGIAAIAANTVLANATGSSASPTAFAMPSCLASSGSALGWISGTGFVCGTGYALTASPTFTGSVTVNNSATSGQTLSLNATSNTSNGASILLAGNGATTPNKYLRAFGGSLQIVNSAGGSIIGQMDDSGDLTVNGYLNFSQTAGLIGTTAANNANAGSVGEYVTATGSSVALTTATTANITSISLTAGDWDVTGGGSIQAAGSGTPTSTIMGVSTTSAAFGGTGTLWNLAFGIGANGGLALPLPVVRVSIASTTTVYCVAQATFSSGSASASCLIRARRVR